MFVCALASIATAAKADDLVMPYACMFDRGEPKLTPANATSFRIVGAREEQTFSNCAPGDGGCTTMMVHKFAIDCDGRRVSWARVAATSAASVGVALPHGLPMGYAPVSNFSARFVLPSLARTSPSLVSVSTQDLSPDSVIETSSLPHAASLPAPWVTVVKADFSPEGSSSALNVAVVLASIMALLTVASVIASGRVRVPALPTQSIVSAAGHAWANAKVAGANVLAVAMRVLSDRWQLWSASRDAGYDESSVTNGLAVVHARLAETELLVATLPVDLLLRDVLLSEIEGVRDRASDIARRFRRLTPDRTSVVLRTLTRELERIGRIAHGASKGPGREPDGSHAEIPKSVFDAYRLLGLNADAPGSAVKKIVDALRQTWHPDHARDDSDRAAREDRMKQINAAWDLIRDRRQAA